MAPEPMPARTWTFVAIDVAKQTNDVLMEYPDGTRQRWRMTNTLHHYRLLRDRLQALTVPPLIGFEATGNYHRPLAYFLGQAGFGYW